MRLLHLRVVLAAVDIDAASASIVEAARELALVAGAKLNIVHAWPPSMATATLGERENALRSVIVRAGVKPTDVPLHMRVGDPAHVIRSLADRLRADVIVLGRHREPQATGRQLGSTALAVVTNAWAPCLVLSRPMRVPLERILVPVDLSDTSRGALVVALSWASALRGAEMLHGPTMNDSVNLTSLFVDRVMDARQNSSRSVQQFDDELNLLRRDAGTWASVAIDGDVIADNDVAKAIAEYAREHQADLVVLGTRGLGLDATGRVGSVSLAVTGQLDIPILLVPPAMWSAQR